MTNWKRAKFGDVIEINPSVSLKRGVSYPFIEMADLSDGRKYTNPSANRILTGGSRFHERDTLFARITPCLENGKICQAKGLTNGVGFGSTEFLVFRGKNGISDTDFVYYLSRSEYVRRYAEQNLVGTSGRQRVAANVFDELEIDLPDLPTQTRIASILSALDDKIELNRQMNHTLEQMAQALFKKYFVEDIDPENLPEGWSNKPIGSLISNAIGGDWGKESRDELHEVQTTIIRGTDFENVVSANLDKIPIRFIKNSNFQKRRLEDGDIVFEISGGTFDQPTGRNLRMSETLINHFGNVVPASFCRLIRPLNKQVGFFLSEYLKHLYMEGGTWDYQNQSTGISNFQFTFFTEKEIVAVPTEGILKSFTSQVEPMVERIDSNILENCSLIKLRNTILPKLMNAEIEIKKAEAILA